MGEEARHQDPGAEVAQPRLRSFAVGQRQRELRVARPRRERQRKSPSKPRIYICDGQRPVRLPEALDVRRPDDADRLGDAAGVLDQLTRP